MTSTMMFAHAVDTALTRLGKVYGPEFTAKHEHLDPFELRELWQQELRAVNNALDAIAWALMHLPDRCPNVRQFATLCNQAPRPQMQAMLPDDTTPTRGPTLAELDVIAQLKQPLERTPRRDWARKLVERAERGERISHAALRMALEVVESDLTPSPSTIDERQLDQQNAAKETT